MKIADPGMRREGLQILSLWGKDPMIVAKWSDGCGVIFAGHTKAKKERHADLNSVNNNFYKKKSIATH